MSSPRGCSCVSTENACAGILHLATLDKTELSHDEMRALGEPYLTEVALPAAFLEKPLEAIERLAKLLGEATTHRGGRGGAFGDGSSQCFHTCETRPRLLLWHGSGMGCTQGWCMKAWEPLGTTRSRVWRS